MIWLPDWIVSAMDLLVALFVLTVGLCVLVIIITFIVDSTQRKDTVLRNYPVIGHFRYVFSTLGEFFRQYFFAMDREELPFNRAEREWVQRASLDHDNTVAFGSTRSLTVPGTAIFVNCPFPTLEADAAKTEPLLFGPHCAQPYASRSILNISGMSYGSISRPAILALSNGARRAGCWMNTGEGGLSPYHLEGGADIVFQIGTAKYGVRTEDGRLSDDKLRSVAAHEAVKMFEIKLSQGAKPGKGGILPADKVTAEIAAIRGIAEGTASNSPNRHPEIDSVEDLLDLIDRIRTVTGKPVGFKTVVGAYGWLEQLCAAVHARGNQSAPDFITIDGGDGGTGAAPMPLMDNVGLTLRESLPLVADILMRAGLKERVRLVCSGKLVTPSSVAWALCAGADAVTSARGFMFALGCIQALKCNKNTCPTGITTHNPRLQAGLDPSEKAVRVAHYCENLVHEVETLAHSCGVSEPRRLRRHHVRIVQDDGLSVPLDKLHPPADNQRGSG